MKIDAKLYDGKSSKEHIVEILFTPDKRVIIKEFNIDVPLKKVKISTRLGNTPRVLEFPGGIRCKSEQNDRVDAILRKLDVKQPIINRLEKSWKIALSSVALIAVVVVFMLTVGADYTANFLAQRLPKSTLDKASKTTLIQLDNTLLHKSNLTQEKKDLVIKQFNKLKDSNRYKLHFRSSPQIGPNAFALPSGDIVILDELILLDKDKELRGVLGVLAHEKAHVVYKHSLRGLIKGTIAYALIGYITGDINFIVSTLPAVIITNNYTKEFEKEADIYAKEELKKLNISTKPLAKLFIAIEEYSKKDNKDSNDTLSGFFSTHPLTKDRVEFFMKD